jgi:NADPH-dependent 2,4-dienoyl-CoA reductase/sulfur reductase-like enzyme
MRQQMQKKISRRGFLKRSAGVVAGATAPGMIAGSGGTAQAAKAATATILIENKAELPAVKGLRAVVVGGGWGGLTIAKHLKMRSPEMDVVLVEKRAIFMSCPISNLWLAGLVDFEFITRSFLDAAKNNNYTFFNATVIDVDRDKRKVYTEKGYIDYDYLVLAPGIDYDYGAIGVHDPAEQLALMTHYPAAFKSGSEHLTLKRKVDNFDGGLFLLTVPSGNYRCLPAPYERACMLASVFKRKKIKGKVILLDFNFDIKIKKEGFRAAFDELYKDYIEYYPSITIVGVDIEKKTVIDEFDDYTFDEAAIYPRIRASKLIETLGLVNKASPQKEARMDQYRNNVVDDLRVYVIGDSRSTAYSKSGSTAQAEARYVAKVITARAKGEEVEWESPYTSCFSMVNADPMEAIYFGSQYLPPQADITAMSMERTIASWTDTGAAFAWRDRNMIRSEEMGQEMLGWAITHYSEMFE